MTAFHKNILKDFINYFKYEDKHLADLNIGDCFIDDNKIRVVVGKDMLIDGGFNKKYNLSYDDGSKDSEIDGHGYRVLVIKQR